MASRLPDMVGVEPPADGPPRTREEAFFFENQRQQLLGVLHTPTVGDVRGGLVFCDPYGEEKHYTHRTFVRFARQLCAEGFCVLRFDYRGNGDSEGGLEDTTLTSQLSDIGCAVDLIAGRCTEAPLGLLGLRMGGTLAALVARDDPRIDMLALWSPILNPKEHFEQLYRNESIAAAWKGATRLERKTLSDALESDGLIEAQDCVLTGRAYSEYSAIDLEEMDLRPGCRVLIADVGRNSGTNRRATERLWAQSDDIERRLIDEPAYWTSVFVYQGMFPVLLCKETSEWLSRDGR